MKILAPLFGFALMAACMSVTMALAVDAYEWELTGSCRDALLIHHLRDCAK